jgi:hypothetical protein
MCRSIVVIVVVIVVVVVVVVVVVNMDRVCYDRSLSSVRNNQRATWNAEQNVDQQ